MNRTIRRTAAALAAACLLALPVGCYNDTGEKRNTYNYGSQKAEMEEDGFKAYGTQQPAGTPIVHDNTMMTFQQAMSDAISALDGVNSAFVIRTDRNAYVALLLDNTATGTRGAGSLTETNNSGADLGQYNPFTFEQGLDGNLVHNGFNNHETVQRPEDLAHALKQRVAMKLRTLDPTLHQVFITANRDFVNRFNMYAQESWKGNSLQPYVGEFNQALNRMFGVETEGVKADYNRP